MPAVILPTVFRLQPAYQGELIGDGLDCAGDVFIKSRVTRLKYWHVILLSSHKQFWGVNLASVKDSVDGNFD